ncbi:extracellular matrix-binding ebh [Babesia caballi]|uniref:Extracellular matrix-binding ebh n=1 Tax=Babesia caballi TaxID=5871 RepID=A0AAV4LZ33_BABCB|nr:extracellular matrix-binding ebh [Babesia caballi]
MTSVGFGSKVLNGSKQGSQIFQDATQNFKDFTEGMSTAQRTATQRLGKENEAKKAIGIDSSSDDSNPTYTEFLGALQKTWSETSFSTIHNESALCPLYYISQLYFNAKQTAISKHPTFKPKSPSTIREMLYFLAALPYSPNYDAFNIGITKHFKNLSDTTSFTYDAELMIAVADSSTSQKHNTLSASDIKQYLGLTCAFSPIVLGRIQGHAADSENEPWLHSLFCNSQFTLAYPSGASLFNALSNYSYALQFQLSFLHQQCMSGSVNCGWLQCKYGKGVPAHNASHICPIECKSSTNPSNCRHDGKTEKSCKHGTICGTQGKSSPLQAFLTDSLKGFSLTKNADPSSSNHLENHPSGSMCHVKMGFNANDLKPSGTGQYIFYTLEPFCGSPISPLRQLCEKFSCLTKRTPGTLGDVFGFHLQLVGQLFHGRFTMVNLASTMLGSLSTFDLSALAPNYKNDPYSISTAIYSYIVSRRSKSESLSGNPSGLSRSFEAIVDNLPFWFQLFMVNGLKELPITLFDLRQHCHNKQKDTFSSEIKHFGPGGDNTCNHSGSNSPGDLWSLYYPVCDSSSHDCKSGNCGGYFFPLAQSTGATYAPQFALTYFSWVLFLADDLQSGLHDFLNEFTNIDCKRSGCKTKSNSTCQCTPGQHGTMGGKQCECNSVVQCGGVLPLIYRHGFQFHDAQSLNGGKDGATKRSCKNFYDQLSNVLAENAPLHNLLLAIDEFMYYVRFRFMSLVSSFWLCSLAILLYFIFYGIDVLHVKSHVHLPSSHNVPPIDLLTTGKAPAVTKLTYYMP